MWGNPGRGLVSEYPRPSRDYAALELTYQISGAERYNVLASYVLSRNRGNTTGIFPSDYGFGMPNMAGISNISMAHAIAPPAEMVSKPYSSQI